MKTAFITGITGQDGAYLAELLLEKNYIVYGLKRRASVDNTKRIKHLLGNTNLHIEPGDMTDGASLISLIQKIKPNEIYNLAAQSYVANSFETPEYTANVDALGALRLLEAIRVLGLEKKTRIYQASTSELYGKAQETPQTEKTPFYPRSPYAAAKLYAYWATINYREAYGIHASNGILFNHESPIRGEEFVTRKITLAVADYIKNKKTPLTLGNLEAKRDWGHAKDYVEAMWLMLQQENPDDYVIATGETHTVREFVEESFKIAGVNVIWKNTGLDEVGLNKDNGDTLIRIDPKYFRPTEVDLLLGDPSKAKARLGWTPKITFKTLVKEMTLSDLQ